MSENLDLVRSIYTAWERGDFGSTEWADDEIEFVVADGPEPGQRTGLPGMAESFRGFLTAWEDWCVEVDEYRELDRERVLVLIQISGHGRRSGVGVGEPRANLLHVHGGKVTRLVSYWDRDRALADLGLAE